MNTSNITNYKSKDFAELIGVFVKTLLHWDREGTLKANRIPTDRRYYTYDQYFQFFSCRLYGLRKYKKQIKEELEIAEELQNRTKSDTGTKIQD